MSVNDINVDKLLNGDGSSYDIELARRTYANSIDAMKQYIKAFTTHSGKDWNFLGIGDGSSLEELCDKPRDEFMKTLKEAYAYSERNKFKQYNIVKYRAVITADEKTKTTIAYGVIVSTMHEDLLVLRYNADTFSFIIDSVSRNEAEIIGHSDAAEEHLDEIFQDITEAKNRYCEGK